MSDSIAIRPARPEDEPAIKRMVRAAHLDPLSLHWLNFLVAEAAGRVIGIGQVKPYPDSRELGSLVVLKSHQGQGVGSAIVRALIARESGELFLLCRAPLETYYAQFGFRRAGWRELRGAVRLKYTVGQFFQLVFRMRFVAMRRTAGDGKG